MQGDVLIAVLQSAFGTLAELDYPYPVTFISSELPGHPADAACVAFNETAGSGLVKLAAAAGIAYNSTGALQCLEIPADAVFEQYLPGLIEGAWTWVPLPIGCLVVSSPSILYVLTASCSPHTPRRQTPSLARLPTRAHIKPTLSAVYTRTTPVTTHSPLHHSWLTPSHGKRLRHCNGPQTQTHMHSGTSVAPKWCSRAR